MNADMAVNINDPVQLRKYMNSLLTKKKKKKKVKDEEDILEDWKEMVAGEPDAKVETAPSAGDEENLEEETEASPILRSRTIIQDKAPKIKHTDKDDSTLEWERYCF